MKTLIVMVMLAIVLVGCTTTNVAQPVVQQKNEGATAGGVMDKDAPPALGEVPVGCDPSYMKCS